MKHKLIHLGLILALFCSMAYCDQMKLAGDAIFPEDKYKDWLQLQRHSGRAEEGLVRNTINIFFILKYESWKDGILYDFGFLFDKSNKQAIIDYTYERGLMFFLLSGWKVIDNLLKAYRYHPRFHSIEVMESTAKVKMLPDASILHRKIPDRIHAGPWGVYTFELVKHDNCWLIKTVNADDEIHDSYPKDTDFDKLTKEKFYRKKVLHDDI